MLGKTFMIFWHVNIWLIEDAIMKPKRGTCLDLEPMLLDCSSNYFHPYVEFIETRPLHTYTILLVSTMSL